MLKELTVPTGFPEHLIKQVYYLFIISTDKDTYYTGITSNVGRRMYQIQNCAVPGLPEYNHWNKLVYIEQYREIGSAVLRESEIKALSDDEKELLVRSQNPQMIDMSYQFNKN